MSLDEFLREWAAAGGEIGQSVQRALDGDTTEAASVWAAISNGEADIATALLWAQKVASRVVSDVVESNHENPKRRADAALKAIGFYGRVDVYREAKQCMSLLADFELIGDDGTRHSAQRLTGKQWLQLLRRSGFLAGVDDDTAINRINEWRKEIEI